jgi:hypothetical protein
MSCPSGIQVESLLNFDQFDDSELRKLANLLATIIIQDIAQDTINTCINVYRLWKRWAYAMGVCPISAGATALALYIVSLIQQQRTVSSINSAVYGIDRVHRKNRYGLSRDHTVVKQVAEAARRILTKPKARSPLKTVKKVGTDPTFSRRILTNYIAKICFSLRVARKKSPRVENGLKGPYTPDAIRQRDAIFQFSLTDNLDPSLNFPNTYLLKFALIGCFINSQKLKSHVALSNRVPCVWTLSQEKAVV